MSERFLAAAVVGQFGPETSESMERRLGRVPGSVAFWADLGESRLRLSSADAVPRCLFVDGRGEPLGPFVAWLRGEARLFSVPVVVMVERIGDEEYVAADALGADDVIQLGDVDAMERRIMSLNRFDPGTRPPITEGRAIVAHADLTRRRVLGRLLRQAGFDVGFAAETTELLGVASEGASPRLVVVAENLPPEGATTTVSVLRAAVGLSDLPVVVIAPPRTASSLIDAGLSSNLAVTSEHAPAHNMLFLANELLRPEVRNLRSAARRLYGSICAFRPAGQFASQSGLTYNISRDGVYVRTLDSPPAGTDIWFEVRPPTESRIVHLRGRVAWGCPYGATGPAPPGFGVRIIAEMCPPQDLETYCLAYDRMV